MKKTISLSRRALSVLLVLVMCLGMFQMPAFAEGETDTQGTVAQEHVDEPSTDVPKTPETPTEPSASTDTPTVPSAEEEKPTATTPDDGNNAGAGDVTPDDKGGETEEAKKAAEEAEAAKKAAEEAMVKEFLDAVAAIPAVTKSNAAEVAEYVYGPVSDAYGELLGTEYEYRADVQAAVARYAAVIDAVDTALGIVSGTYEATGTSLFSRTYHIYDQNFVEELEYGRPNLKVSVGVGETWTDQGEMLINDKGYDIYKVTSWDSVSVWSTNENVLKVTVQKSGSTLKITYEGISDGTASVRIAFNATTSSQGHGIYGPAGMSGAAAVSGCTFATVTVGTGGSGGSGGESGDKPTTTENKYHYVNLPVGATMDFLGLYQNGIYPSKVENYTSNSNVAVISSYTIDEGQVYPAITGVGPGDTEVYCTYSSRDGTRKMVEKFTVHVYAPKTVTISEETGLWFEYSGATPNSNPYVGNEKIVTAYWGSYNYSLAGIIVTPKQQAGTTRVGGWHYNITKVGGYASYDSFTISCDEWIVKVEDTTPKTYTVIYDDGVGSTDPSAFERQEYKNLSEGSDTPKFQSGTPTRAGYTFKGWRLVTKDELLTPAGTVRDKVKADDADAKGTIAYVAQWEPTVPTKDEAAEILNGKYTVKVVCTNDERKHNLSEKEYGITAADITSIGTPAKENGVWKLYVNSTNDTFISKFNEETGVECAHDEKSDGFGIRLTWDGSKWTYSETTVKTIETECHPTPEEPKTTQLAIYKVFSGVDAIPEGFAIEYTLDGKTVALNKDTTGVKFYDNGLGVMWIVEVPVGQEIALTEKNADVTGKNLTVAASVDSASSWWTGTVTASGQQITVNVPAASSSGTTDPGTVETPVAPVVKISNTYTDKPANVVIDKTNDSLKGFTFDPESGNAVVEYTVTVTNKSGFPLYGLKLTDEMKAPILTPKTGAEGTPSVKLTFSNWQVQKTANGTFEPITPYEGGDNDMTHQLALLGRNDEFADNQTVTLKYTVEIVPNNVPATIKLNNWATAGYWLSEYQPTTYKVMARVASTDPFPDDPDGTVSAGSGTGGDVGGSTGGAGSTTEGETKGKYSLTYSWNLPEGADPAKTLPTDNRMQTGGIPEGAHFTVDTENKEGDTVTVNGETWTFSGWNEPELTKEATGNYEGQYIMPDHDVVIEGTWTKTAVPPTPIDPDTIQVRYLVKWLVKDTGTGTDTELKSVIRGPEKVGTEVAVKEDDKTYTGYTFDADNDSNVLKGALSKDEVLILKLYFTKNEEKPDEPVNPKWDDLTIKKEASVEKAKAGDEITYTITVTNNTGKDLKDIKVKEVLPVQVTLKDTAPTGYSDGVWTISELENGKTATLVLTVMVNAGVADTTIFNTATVTEASTTDTTPEKLPDDKKPTDTAEVTVPKGDEPEQTYTVTYVLNGGTSSEDLVYSGLKSGESTPTIANPTRDGYTFTGWSPAVADTVTGDATYTAQWRPTGGGGNPDPVTYTVTYDLNGGSSGAQLVYPNLTAGASTPRIADPSREGYFFAGWTPTVASTVTGNITYVAQWTEVTDIPDDPNVPGGDQPDNPDNPDDPGVDIPDEPVPGGDQPDLPDEPDDPGIDIPDEPTPGGDRPVIPTRPVTPTTPGLTDIPDEEVPLADTPETGDNVWVWYLTALLSAAGIAVLAVLENKKRAKH